jgi:hypothetical protein
MLLGSSAFPRTKAFAERYLKNLYRQLKDVPLLENLPDGEQVKRSIQIAAKIDLIETLRNRPQRLIDQLKEYRKEQEE